MIPDTETSIGVTFCTAFKQTIYRTGVGTKLKCKAYFAEFGQSECVNFTINETSNKEVFT